LQIVAVWIATREAQTASAAGVPARRGKSLKSLVNTQPVPARAQRNTPIGSAELERVLKQVRYRGREQVPVAVDHQIAIDRMH
jgi:hypothetical protein